MLFAPRRRLQTSHAMRDTPDCDRPMHIIAAGHAAVRDADEDGVVGQEQRPTAMPQKSTTTDVSDLRALALRCRICISRVYVCLGYQGTPPHRAAQGKSKDEAPSKNS